MLLRVIIDKNYVYGDKMLKNNAANSAHQNSLFYGESVISDRVIHTPSVFARSNLIHLQEVGSLTAQRVHESKRNNLNSYLFFIVLSGSGTLTVDNVKYEMKKGDCGFIDCSGSYSHCSSQDLWKLQWVHFYAENMKEIYDKYKQRGGQPFFKAKNPQIFSAVISEIYDIASSHSSLIDMELFEKLTTLLTELMRNSETNDFNSSLKRKDIDNIREYIELHYREKIDLDSLSDMFYVNKYYMCHLFKKLYGTTVIGYISQLRITNAKKLLRFTDKTTQEIGLYCGYSDTNYFIRAFKKSEGMTPCEYRRSWIL